MDKASANQASIALIIPYFGSFNNYFPLFLESCRANPTVDWFIYTDSEQNYEWPENVHVQRTTFREIKERVQQCFGFPVSLEQPYKLCDFKPAYGEIFQEDVADYDFWGHCDCDLIFGDIRRFISPKITDTYEKILTRGHLTLYRNTSEVNAYYRTQRWIDYQQVMKDPVNRTFDEWGGVSQCWQKDGKPYFDELCYDDIRVGLQGFYPTKEIKWKTHSPYNYGQQDESARYSKMQHIAYTFQNGKLERVWIQGNSVCSEEVLYVHLQKRKMVVDQELLSTVHKNSDSRFLIHPNRFVVWKEPTLEFLRQNTPGRLVGSDMKIRMRNAASAVVHTVIPNR